MPWLSKTIFDMGFDELILSCWKWKKDIKSNILNLEKQIMSLDTIKVNDIPLLADTVVIRKLRPEFKFPAKIEMAFLKY